MLNLVVGRSGVDDDLHPAAIQEQRLEQRMAAWCEFAAGGAVS